MLLLLLLLQWCCCCALLMLLLHQQHSQLAPRPLAFCLHTLTQDLVLMVQRICSDLWAASYGRIWRRFWPEMLGDQSSMRIERN